MIFFFLSFVVPFVENPPKIDGILEEVWNLSPVISNFTQQEPLEGEPATESTYVYLLQDKENLYVAFKCYQGVKPVLEIRGWDNASGDYVTIFIDTYGDGDKAYFFTVSTSGTQEDGIVVRGGVSSDYTWNGIWFAKAYLTDYGYNVEMKIPFKSIRYKNGEWGLQASRWIDKKDEWDYYIPVKRFQGLRVCDFSKIVVHPEIKGRFLEVYPVALVKYSSDLRPDMGLDISYNPAPSFGLNLTTNPDFAEVEADPFTVNLSKYAIYLQERRPFFIEGQDLFKLHMSGNFNIGGSPIRVLYTRNIGRIVDDSTKVPVLFGMKEILKIKNIENALMYVLTGEAGNEPLSHYIAFRTKTSLSQFLNCGFTYTGKENTINSTRVLTFDGSYLKGNNDILFQGSFGDSSGKRGPAFYGNYSFMNDKFMFSANGSYIDGNYAINEVGYITSKGYSFIGGFGPVFVPQNIVKYWGFALGSVFGKDFEVKNPSLGFFVFTFINMKKSNINWSFSISDHWEDTSNVDFNYKSKSGNFNIHHRFSEKLRGGFWANLNYGFNWSSYYTCYYSNYGFYANFEPLPNIHFDFDVDGVGWWEEGLKMFDLRLKNMEENYITFSPELDYYFSTRIKFGLRTQFVYENNTNSIISERINPIITYNISPKSWIYLVYTVTYDRDNKMIKTDEGSTFKIRYLFYF